MEISIFNVVKSIIFKCFLALESFLEKPFLSPLEPESAHTDFL